MTKAKTPPEPTAEPPVALPATLSLESITVPQPVLPLRAWLAGQALAGYMGTITARADVAFTEPAHAEALGSFCVRSADAVIAALEREGA
jgi:hypothetical protein